MSNRISGILLLIIGVVATKMSGDGTALILFAMLAVAEVIPSKAEQKAIIRVIHRISKAKQHRTNNKRYSYKPAMF